MWNQICYGPFTTKFGVSKSCAINTIWYSNSTFNINFHRTLLNLRISNNWGQNYSLDLGPCLRITLMQLKLLTFSCLGILSSRTVFGISSSMLWDPMGTIEKFCRHFMFMLWAQALYKLWLHSVFVLRTWVLIVCTWVRFDLCACFWCDNFFSLFHWDLDFHLVHVLMCIDFNCAGHWSCSIWQLQYLWWRIKCCS
jgi:hypothetical protein